MPPADRIHGAVKNALVKDGWTITDDPYILEYEDARLFADLAAERTLAAERNGRRIVVEIKSFLGPSPLHDFEVALGQYLFYRGLLQQTAPEYEMYLAVSDEAHARVLARKSVELLLNQHHVSVLVVDLEREEVIQWTN
jgi:XisH protein